VLGRSFVFTVGGMTITVGEALVVKATSQFTVTYTDSGSGNPTFSTTAISATMTSPLFPGTGAAITGFALRQDGFDIASASVTIANARLGSILSADSVTLSVNNLSVNYGQTSSISDSPDGTSSANTHVDLSVTNLKLFPGGNYLSSNITATAAFDFGNFDGASPSGRLKISVTNLTLSLGEAVQIQAGTAANPIIITPDQSVIASIPSAMLTFPQFPNAGTVTLSNFQLSQTGFSLGSLTYKVPKPASGSDPFNNILSYDGRLEEGFSIDQDAARPDAGRRPIVHRGRAEYHHSYGSVQSLHRATSDRRHLACGVQ
jgi:hypothetical protein